MKKALILATKERNTNSCKKTRMLRYAFFTVFLVAFLAPASAQEITQVIRGQIVDKDSKFPLIGANVLVMSDTAKTLGATTDVDGKYRIEGVSIGHHTIRFSYVGYQDQLKNNIIVSSAKEVILNVELEESSIQIEAVEITATRNKGEVLNEMATVSARQFSVEETDRYAGSRGDPARMASNFAGVQGADDSRNDIIIRGNSPNGVLYRVEGVDIPNPNHFSIAGSAGGPVSILNNKVMANSDFFTGAFPAEFGNSIAGVFDLRLRNGNNEKHEFTGQFGFLGTELMGEGPINKEKRSSYLATYRYSTVSLFSLLGIDIGTDAVPKYQDFSFKLNFPTKGGANLSLFAIGGMSDIDILISDQEKPDIDFFGENDKDQFFGTGMGIIGLSYTKPINETTYLKTTVAASIEEQHSKHDFIHRHVDNDGFYVVDSTYQFMGYKFQQSKMTLATFVNKKINKKNVLKFGANLDYFAFNFQDSILNTFHTDFNTRWDYKGSAVLAQPYIQLKHKFSDDLVLNLGLHSQYFSQGDALSPIEPRVGLKWNLNDNQSLSWGVGMHSQILPTYTYFYQLNETDPPHNSDLGFIKSNHYVMGYDNAITKSARIKMEIYYQSLTNVPVEQDTSAFSLVNQGSGFSRFFPDKLENEGTGTNYGFEFTLEKFFGKQFFFMFTASVFESKYKGSDDIERSTDYNGNYAVNGLFGKEFKTGEKSTLSIGGKVTAVGGKRYGIVDTAASNLAGEVLYGNDGYNSNQFKDYFRADLKINFKINSKKVTHEIALDLVNLLGTQNILNLTYAPDHPSGNPIQENYQLGFLPIFYYKIDF
jgi:hypothetical protein